VDEARVPARAVLVVQQDDGSPVALKRAGAGVLQQHERQEPHQLGLGREHAQQQAHQPDGLVGQRRALGLGGGAVALVEHQLQHGGHGAQALGALGWRGVAEGHARSGHLAFGARDALLHGGLGHHEGARDLRHAQPRHDAQRERDLLRGRQLGVAADEQQPQHVVAVVAVVQALHQLGLGVRGQTVHALGRGLAQGSLLGAAAHAVERGVAAHHDQPAAGSRGGPFSGHTLSARRHASW
jgi:hypothetical protein